MARWGVNSVLMQVRIADLEAGKNVYSFTAKEDELGLNSKDASLNGGVFVDVLVEKREASLLFSGTIVLQMNTVCSRCLASMVTALDISFAMPGTILDEGGIAPEDAGDSILVNRQQAVVDLTDVIREQILMALPEKTLCDETCKGLCPQCGADLNKKSCSCATGKIDARWSKLAELKNKN